MNYFFFILLPLFSSFGLLGIALRAKISNEPMMTVEKWGSNFIIRNSHVARLAIVFSSLWIVPYYYSVNLTRFYPQNLQMDVFYDKKGLLDSIEAFPREALEDIGYVPGASARADEYYQLVDEKRQEIAGRETFFSGNRDRIHSHGSVTFIVEKREGFQKYQVVHAEGHLNHVYDAVQAGQERFFTFIVKIPTKFDYIEPTLSDIFLDRSVVIQPRFRQIIAAYEKADGIEFNHQLVGMTQIYIWPIPSYSNTVYFFKAGDGAAIPIGYAIYR